MRTFIIVMKVARVDAVTRMDVTEVEAEVEAPVMDAVEVAGEHTTTAESLSTFRRIVGNQVAEHVMRKRKTKEMTLVIQTSFQASTPKLHVVLQEVLNLENAI